MAAARVLVVDDEPAVLKLVSSALTHRGYEVHGVSDPVEALRAVREPPGYDLVISDVIMPRLCGPELVTRITALNPTIGVVLMSGNINREKVPPATAFIPKPFAMKDLYSVVANTLNESRRLRIQTDERCLRVIDTELDLCLTLADIAETRYRKGQTEAVARTVAKVEKGYSDALQFLSIPEGKLVASEELLVKIKRVRERLDGLRHLP